MSFFRNVARYSAAIIALLALSAAVIVAHAGHDHVRGVVTKVSAQSITVQTADNTTKTLTISDKTAVQQAGKPVQIADVKVGDRVVVDVPEKKTEAVLIRIGAGKAAQK